MRFATLYQFLQRISRLDDSLSSIKSTGGEVLTDAKVVLARWAEHYNAVFSHPPPDEPIGAVDVLASGLGYLGLGFSVFCNSTAVIACKRGNREHPTSR